MLAAQIGPLFAAGGISTSKLPTHTDEVVIHLPDVVGRSVDCGNGLKVTLLPSKLSLPPTKAKEAKSKHSWIRRKTSTLPLTNIFQTTQELLPRQFLNPNELPKDPLCSNHKHPPIPDKPSQWVRRKRKVASNPPKQTQWVRRKKI